MNRVRFWGTRGSLPVALTASAVRAKITAALRGTVGRTLTSNAEVEAYVDGLDFTVSGTFGGHSPCVELVGDGPDYFVCDLGTGIRPFGHSAMARGRDNGPQTFHIFMSHVHWDHIMGFPFFVPAYRPGNRIRIYGGHQVLETALRRQQAAPSFPVDFSALAATIEFIRLDPDRDYDIGGLNVRLMLQKHAGDSYGYRFSANGRTVVYSTDSEHKLDDMDDMQRFADFFRGADVVVFDAMYSLADSISVKADWGHSSNITGVDLCHLAGARHLCLFHHEPVHADEAIARMLEETQRYERLVRRDATELRVSAAYDGMEIHL